MSDTVRIDGLKVDALIGAYAHERSRPRPLTVDVTMACDLRKAGRSDELVDTIDYGAVAERLRTIAAASSYVLIEALAEEMSGACLEYAGVTSVTLTIKKSGAVPNTDAVAVTIVRP